MAIRLELDEATIGRIRDLVNGLEYGSVQITVHDGRIAQIERTERKRFEPQAHAPSGVRKMSTRP